MRRSFVPGLAAAILIVLALLIRAPTPTPARTTGPPGPARRSNPPDIADAKANRPIEPGPPTTTHSDQAPDARLLKHFGLTERDRQEDATFRQAFLTQAERRTEGEVNAYRQFYALSEDQARQLQTRMRDSTAKDAEYWWSRFDWVKCQLAGRDIADADLAAAVQDAWSRYSDPSAASNNPVTSQEERRARLREWDRFLESLFDATQRALLRDVKNENARWMTAPDRHASEISDLQDSMQAQGAALTRFQLMQIAGDLRSHAEARPEVLGSLPYASRGYPLGLIDWNDPRLRSGMEQVLSQPQKAAFDRIK